MVFSMGLLFSDPPPRLSTRRVWVTTFSDDHFSSPLRTFKSGCHEERSRCLFEGWPPQAEATKKGGVNVDPNINQPQFLS